MRICYLNKANKINLGIYACSQENSLFIATFTNMKVQNTKGELMIGSNHISLQLR